MKQNTKFAGYSLIEMAVTLVIVGMLVSVVATLYPQINQTSAEKNNQQQTQAVQDAILGFAFANNRLPCPANSLLGVEDCSVDKGFLAWRSLGFSQAIENQNGRAMYYAVFDNALTSAPTDMELSVLKDRFSPYMATHAAGENPEASNSILNSGSPNGLDLCQAIKNAAETDYDPLRLNVGSVSETENVAYVVVDVGMMDADNDNSIFDGENSDVATDLRYEHPMTIKSLLYDDKVYAKTFDQLWAELACSDVIAAVGHAHPNIATTAAITHQALEDYLVQAQLAADVASADVAAAVAALLSGTGATAAAAATIPIATSESINTAGAMAPTAALSVAAVAAAAASMVTAAVVTAMAAVNKSGADDLVGDVQTKLNEINTLSNSIKANAIAADAAGLYQK